jgi:hypothetical protein
MFETTKALYVQLAKALGVSSIPADAKGLVQLDVEEDSTLALVPEDPYTLTVISPVAALPAEIDRGTLLWLMRRNFHDSPISPFRIACDAAGNLVVWGRLPIDGMSGEQLAGLLDAVAAEVRLIREEIAVDEGPEEQEADEEDSELRTA